MTSEVRAAVAAGQTVPSSWYTDPAVFRKEQARILRTGWHYVTDTSRLRAVGDQVTWDIGGVPIVLVRDAGDDIRGFVNICRHRAHPVVLEDQCRNTLQCHYHGWTYALDGSLRNAPRSSEEPSFDPSPLGLQPIQVHVWGPMVWANVSTDAPAFDDDADGLDAHLRSTGCRVEEHELAFGHEWEIACNWKVFQDNTIECYHCPTTHPEFSRAIVQDPERQLLGIGGPNWIHHALPFRDDASRWYHFCWLLPGTYLQHTGRGFDVGTVEIIDVDRLHLRHIGFAPATDTPEQIARAQALLDADPTLDQDTEICRLVQRSHDAGVAPPGRLLAGRELLLTHLYRRIVEMMEH